MAMVACIGAGSMKGAPTVEFGEVLGNTVLNHGAFETQWFQGCAD